MSCSTLGGGAGGANLISVDVTPGAVFQSGTPKSLFSLQGFGNIVLNLFDVSPDGQRFLLTRPLGGESADALPDRIVIVQNFLAELRAKVR